MSKKYERLNRLFWTIVFERWEKINYNGEGDIIAFIALELYGRDKYEL